MVAWLQASASKLNTAAVDDKLSDLVWMCDMLSFPDVYGIGYVLII